MSDRAFNLSLTALVVLAGVLFGLLIDPVGGACLVSAVGLAVTAARRL